MSFAEEFAQGLQAGQAAAQRRQAQAMAQRQQRIGEQTTAQESGLRLLSVLQGQPAPRKYVSPEAGGVGPPEIGVPEAVQIPGLVELGQPAVVARVTPQTQEALLAQKRASMDEMVRQEAAKFAREQQIKDELEAVDVMPASPLIRFGLKPGRYKPQEIAAYTSLVNAGESASARREARTAAASARAETAAERAREKDETVSSIVDGLRDATISIERIPVKYMGAVMASARAAGVKPLPAKTIEAAKSIQGLEGLASAIDARFDPSAVGPIQGRIPDIVAGGKRVQFRSMAQGLFNEVGKLRSGGAITDNELERLLAELPTPTDTEDNFKAKMANFRSLLAIKRASLVGGVNFDISGVSDPSRFHSALESGGAAPAPSGSGVVEWTRDANGNPVRK